MATGTVKFFNSQKGLASFSRTTVGRTCSSIFLQSSAPACAASMKGGSSGTTLSASAARRPLQICRTFNIAKIEKRVSLQDGRAVVAMTMLLSDLSGKDGLPALPSEPSQSRGLPFG